MPWRPRTHNQTARQPRGHDRTTTERGYGWDWQKLIDRLKQERPLCEFEQRFHPGIVKPSEHGHHLRKVKHRPDLRLAPENVAMICEECHTRVTALGE